MVLKVYSIKINDNFNDTSSYFSNTIAIKYYKNDNFAV